MLPELLYKALPYLYIAAGLLFAAIIDSDIVVFPSILLVSVGLVVMWMRRETKKVVVFRKPGKRLTRKGASLPVKGAKEYKLRERTRRLPEEDRKFPLTDDNHNMVAFNRRSGERRKKKK